MEILQSTKFYNCQGNAKTAETPSMENVSEENSAHSAGGGWQQMEWREKKSKLRDTFAQLVNDLDSCGEHVCVCVLVYWCVCVCVHITCADWLSIESSSSSLGGVGSCVSWTLDPTPKMCVPTNVRVSVFCLLFYMNFRSKTKRRQQQRTSERVREWEKERVRKLRQLLGALQPEVDFRVEFFAPFQCFHCNWSGLFYWVSSWNRAKPKPKAEEPHTPSFLTRYR